MEKKTLFVDSCAWDILHRHQVELSSELPAEEFEICMTKEVAAFEIPCVPGGEGASMKGYIEHQIEERGIRVDALFGFSSYGDPPGYRSRLGGFGESRWVTYTLGALLNEFKVPETGERPTGLYKNEEDASLAVRSLGGGIVLTAESAAKAGPLKKAALRGGKIVDLSRFDPAQSSLRDFILGAAPPSCSPEPGTED